MLVSFLNSFVNFSTIFDICHSFLAIVFSGLWLLVIESKTKWTQCVWWVLTNTILGSNILLEIFYFFDKTGLKPYVVSLVKNYEKTPLEFFDLSFVTMKLKLGQLKKIIKIIYSALGNPESIPNILKSRC